jgi:signal transduction histidine kinase
LRLPSVTIQVEGSTTVHQVGSVPPEWPSETVALEHEGRAAGHIRLAARDDDAGLEPADRAALAPVLRHLAALAHAEQLDEQLRASHLELVTAREEERRRLRNDLHDGLGPALSAIRLTLAAAGNLLERDPDGAAPHLRDARAQLTDAIDDVRRLVYGLRPPSLDQLGLVGSLQSFAHGLSTDIPVEVVAPERLPPLPAATELAAYRIALEAMTNTVRHAGARRCAVRLAAEGGTLVLEVEDDGTPQVPFVEGVGLTSIRERATESGGCCEVLTGESGTVVVARLPMTGALDD